MSEIIYEEFVLEKLFSYVSGNIDYNKSYCHNNQGAYPVYTATVGEPIGFISSYDYEGEYLSWTVDGVNSGTVEILNGKFNTGNGRGLLIPLVNGINLRYIGFILEPICKREASGRGRGGTPHCKWSHIKEKKIKLPILSNGSFDYDYQCTLADKYTNIMEQRDCLRARIKELDEISVRLPKSKDIKWKDVLVKDLFIPKKGDSSYTKTYCKNHKGNIPLYSGNTEGVYDYIDTFDYDGKYLTWAKDGLAGYMMLHNGKFSLTGHRGILLPTDKCSNIDLKYIKFVLEPIFRASKKGREGDLGKNEYTTLNSDMIKKLSDSIPIPVNEDGTFNLSKQIELSTRYEQIENIKTELQHKLIELTDIVIS